MATADGRVVFDTGLYIDAIRGGLASPAFERLQARLPRTHLASVVVAELLAGAPDEVGRRAVLRLTRWAERVGRVVTPSAASWERAGGVLAHIRRAEPQLRSKVPTLWNDLLIALSAGQIGAMLVTGDARDFQLLRRYVRFDLNVVP